MPLLRINATSGGLTLHDTYQPAAHRLCSVASRPGPAVIMLHGYKYEPGSRHHCPHSKLFSTENGWPAQLGFDGQNPDEGLAIALGWSARGPLKTVHRRAAEMGESVAVIVAMLRHHTPGRPVHIIAHSLGSEAALSALQHLPEGAVDRMVLLTGATFRGRAQDMLATPAGRTVEVLNVTSRENDLFDAGFERLVRHGTPGDRTIGQGIAAPNAANIQLDCPLTLDGFQSIGHSVAAPARRICHWSAYKRPGVMGFYKAFLRDPERLSFDRLTRALPQTTAPRWSRLFPVTAGAKPKRDTFLPTAPHRVGSSAYHDTPSITRRHENEPAY